MDIVNYVDTVTGRVIGTEPFDVAARRTGGTEPGVIGIVADRVLPDAEAVSMALYLISLPVE